MLTLSGLNTFYGQAHILRDVSLELPDGACVALLGRNGAGKSTTMKAIMGMIPAHSGTVSYGARELKKMKPYQRARLGLGYVPEERRIFRHLSVLENLEVGEKPPRAGRAPWTIRRVFDLFPALEDLKGRMGGQLSGGEQQMLTVARTLMTNPETLLLDEPTEGLAPLVVEQVASAIRTLKAQGLAILLSEQNRMTASKLADSAVVLEKGEVIYAGPFAAMSKTAHQALGW